MKRLSLRDAARGSDAFAASSPAEKTISVKVSIKPGQPH